MAPTYRRIGVRVTSKRDEFNELVTHRFPTGTRAADLRAWRVETRRGLQERLEQHKQQRAATLGTAGTLRADVQDRYLPAIQAMTTYSDRLREIAVWVDLFGDRPRSSIAPHEIRAARDRWLTTGPRRRWRRINGVGQWEDVAEPLAAGTVNKRLRALSNVYTVLDGRRAPNPAREVPEAREESAVPHDIPYDVIRAILATMPDVGVGRRGLKRTAYSLSKVRSRCMAWTGIEPKELGRIEPWGIRIDERIVVVPPRRKGRGAVGRIVPLNDEGVAAFQDLLTYKACGRFDRRTTLRAWQRACRLVVGRPLRLKDLRHSFVTSVVRATKNLSTAQMLAGHADARTTKRYAISALLGTMQDGIAAFTESVKEKPS